ncbi:MAG: hypothetical protein Q7R33_04815 [Nitrosarchaeum sp.]|nr:hypothetical protein [Nitrosarchaeum sp.]
MTMTTPELWLNLINLGKFNVIALLADVEKGKVHTLQINKQLTPDRKVNETILNYLIDHNVKIQKSA